ncbi:hypothetical protein QTP88_012120 [Uroleucon formosanum]
MNGQSIFFMIRDKTWRIQVTSENSRKSNSEMQVLSEREVMQNVFAELRAAKFRIPDFPSSDRYIAGPQISQGISRYQSIPNSIALSHRTNNTAAGDNATAEHLTESRKLSDI